jgi:phosphinothricin acetyltransferase
MEHQIIRPVHENDAGVICSIYNYYISGTHFTFEEDLLGKHIIKERIWQVSKHFPWLVCEINGEIVGYAYATTWKTRSAYRFTAESTVYLKHDFVEKGVGSLLYQNLIEQLRKSGFHCVLATISLPNDASIGFHRKFGFKETGIIREVGLKFNRRIDVGIYQLIVS